MAIRESGVINKEVAEQVFGKQKRFSGALGLIRSVTFPHELAWLEAQRPLSSLIIGYDNGRFDPDVVKKLFVTGREAYRITTQSGQTDFHLARYKRTRAEIMSKIPSAQLHEYHEIRRLFEEELIDGPLTLVSERGS